MSEVPGCEFQVGGFDVNRVALLRSYLARHSSPVTRHSDPCLPQRIYHPTDGSAKGGVFGFELDG